MIEISDITTEENEFFVSVWRFLLTIDGETFGYYELSKDQFSSNNQLDQAKALVYLEGFENKFKEVINKRNNLGFDKNLIISGYIMADDILTASPIVPVDTEDKKAAATNEAAKGGKKSLALITLCLPEWINKLEERIEALEKAK